MKFLIFYLFLESFSNILSLSLPLNTTLQATEIPHLSNSELSHKWRKLRHSLKLQNTTITSLKNKIKLEENINTELLKLKINNSNATGNSTSCTQVNQSDNYDRSIYPFQPVPLKFWSSSNTQISDYSFYHNMKFEAMNKERWENKIKQRIEEINGKLHHIKAMGDEIKAMEKEISREDSVVNYINNKTLSLNSRVNEVETKVRKHGKMKSLKYNPFK